jgi:hypothetical protein
LSDPAMTAAKCIALMMAGVAVTAIFMIAALVVFAIMIWILAGAVDFLAGFGGERQASRGPSARHFL